MGGDAKYYLKVRVPGENIFDAYYYGYGLVVSVLQVDKEEFEVTVDYGTDYQRAENQAARFCSGLYWAEVIEN